MLHSLKLPVLTAAAALLIGSPALANTITLTTPAGSTNQGLTVNATATFTTNNGGTIDVSVQNLLTAAQEQSVAQNISGIFFRLSTGQSAGTLTSMSGAGENVAGDGTSSASTPATLTSGWNFNQGTTFELCVLACSGAGPSETIIGGAVGNTYSNAGGSIAGNNPHNPFLVGTVQFHLSIPGVTAATDISAITFQFGTTEGDGHVGGQCTTCGSPLPPAVTPEPGSLLLLGTGLVGGAALLRRRFLL